MTTQQIAFALIAVAAVWWLGSFIPWRKLGAKFKSAATSIDVIEFDDEAIEHSVFAAWCLQRNWLISQHDTTALKRHNENLDALFGGRFEPPANLVAPGGVELKGGSQ